MYAAKFGDVYASATALPTRRPEEDVGADAVSPSNIIVPGGSFDSSGDQTIYPQGRTMTVRGVYLGTSAANILSTVDGLRALRGTKSKLWLLCNDASTRWRYARLLEVRQPVDVDRRARWVQEVECVFELDGSGVWKGADGTHTIDLTGSIANDFSGVSNDGNVDCRDVVLRLQNWGKADGTPAKVWFYEDDPEAWTDLTETYDDDENTNDGAWLSTGGYLYIGHETSQFASVYVEMATRIDNVSSTLSVEIYDGSWTAATGVSDGTFRVQETLCGSGRVRWDMATMTTTTVNSAGPYYWCRFSVSATLDDEPVIKELYPYTSAPDLTAFTVHNRTEGHESKIEYTGTVTNTQEIEIDCDTWSVCMWVTPDEAKEYQTTPTYLDMPGARDDDEDTYYTFWATISSGDMIYIGHSAVFDAVRVEMYTVNDQSSTTLYLEYYNGSSWDFMPGLDDGTRTGGIAFGQDGIIEFNLPTDWATVAVDSDTKYWIRIRPLTGSIDKTACQISEIDVRLTTDLFANLSRDGVHTIAEWCRLARGANPFRVTRTGGGSMTDLDVEFEDTYA